MEKISLNDHVRSEDGLRRVKRERKTNWIDHMLLRNCLIKHVIEGKIQMTVRREGRPKQLLGVLKEKRRY
jgi:hypothetical protein